MNEMMEQICGFLSQQYDFGTEIIALIQSQCRDGIGAVICPDHLGDTFWAGSFAGEVKRQHGYRKVLYVCKPEHEEMLKLFLDIDLTMGLEKEEMEAVVHFFYLQQKRREGDVLFAGFPFIIGFHLPAIERIQRVSDLGGSLNHCFEIFMGLTAPTKKSHIRILENQGDKEYKEQFSHTVLLSPGAYSVDPIPTEFWEKLADRLLKIGMDVYTNDGNQDCDKMIPGTKPLSVSIPELVQIAEHLTFFVGLRSGLCDVLAQTSLRMAVIFSKAHERMALEVTEQDMWMHTVWEMDRKEGITPYQYVPELEDLLIYKICESIGTV